MPCSRINYSHIWTSNDGTGMARALRREDFINLTGALSNFVAESIVMSIQELIIKLQEKYQKTLMKLLSEQNLLADDERLAFNSIS